ncbi:probable allantoinase 1 [Microplitis mediator]|uniref:probable allantoinase 1 n=1 Tax=Microplitis mediator TaxID=375433 RepID=UPI00255499DA|nr:probable allantoinase 1 [Microplitis mediator]
MSSEIKAFVSQRTVFDDEVLPAIVVVLNEKIHEVICGDINEEIKHVKNKYSGIIIEDFGSNVLMPGLVDSHVHIDDPGRTQWEEFKTATKAAAAGGVTTIIDMPLNSIPPTTTVDNLKTKIKSAEGNVFVDVGFWGGVVPGNTNELKKMVEAGVVGFKCFLIPSGTEEFKFVTLPEVEEALRELQATPTVLAFHAELEDKVSVEGMDPTLYKTFLHSRPSSMEVRAIEAVSLLCKKYNVRCHIVHLSASEALDVVSDAKKNSVPLTAETCYHYLTITDDEIPNCDTRFKCCPPIRSKENQEKLWKALENGVLDMIVSDHSPCTQDLKSNSFIDAWGGISSLQFGLPIIWTEAQRRKINICKIARYVSTNPAKLCGLDKIKGRIYPGMDADFVVWDPESQLMVQKADILYKNKISPYEGKIFYGRVVSTILRGNFIYKNGLLTENPKGNLILNKRYS